MTAIFDIAADVSTLVGLAGFVVAAFFLIARQILKRDIFPRLTRTLSAALLSRLIDRFFWLSVLGMLLGFLGFAIGAIPQTSGEREFAAPFLGMIRPVFETGSSIDLLPEPDMKNVVIELKILPEADAYTPISSRAEIHFKSVRSADVWTHPVEIDVDPRGIQPKVKSYIGLDTLIPREKYKQLIDDTSRTRAQVVLSYDPDVQKSDVTFATPWFDFNRDTIKEAP